MKRRDIMACISVTTAGFAGCVSGPLQDLAIGDSEPSGDDRDRTQCEHIATVWSLPKQAKIEAQAAIEDGGYETTGELLLPEVFDIDSSYLRTYDGESAYWEMTVETTGDVTRLRAEQTWPEADPMVVLNSTEMDVKIDLRVTHEGKLLTEGTVAVGADQYLRFDEDAEYRYGEYRADVSVQNIADLSNEEVTWTVSEDDPAGGVAIHSDPYEVRPHSGPVSYIYCEWNDDGELVRGTIDTSS